VQKVREIYARTKSKVKMGEKKEGEWFETTKGVKQGCPLNLKRRGGVIVYQNNCNIRYCGVSWLLECNFAYGHNQWGNESLLTAVGSD
jgi:hypothetical protein